MKKILTYKGAVMTWECDSNRHMNVMYYINKFEHAGRNFGMELGLHDIETSEKTGVVVLEQKINYLREVFEDNLLYVESTLLKVGNKTFTVLHEMYRNPQKELVAKMELVLVLFDKVNRKALAFPEDKKEVLLKMLES
ncbi:MAG: acyl-CoA thioesterase [Chitinophagales bacterium]